jgi:hypothetical protein
MSLPTTINYDNKTIKEIHSAIHRGLHLGQLLAKNLAAKTTPTRENKQIFEASKNATKPT